MSHHYSLFSSRARARREKFASAKTSCSSSWDQSSGDDENRMPGFPNLPSPTIGGGKASLSLETLVHASRSSSQGQIIPSSNRPAGKVGAPGSVGIKVKNISPVSVRKREKGVAAQVHSRSSKCQSEGPINDAKVQPQAEKTHAVSKKSLPDPVTPFSFYNKEVATQCASFSQMLQVRCL